MNQPATHNRRFPGEHLWGAIGLMLLCAGSYFGLVVAPPERYMGDVGRILYMHVPTAWAALFAFTAAFVCAIGSLITRRNMWDDLLVACVEVGIVLTIMLLLQGSIWAKPTWGVFWTWDARLTTSAIMLVVFFGVLALRALVDDPIRRANWTAVTAIVAYLDVPIVYFSVKWWRTLHQGFSTSGTISSPMRLPLYLNAVAMLLLAGWLVVRRARLSACLRAAAQSDKPVPQAPGLVAGDHDGA